MESALFRDFFGNFFHARWKILFSCGGEHARCVWNEHRKTRNSEKLKFLFWVEGSIGGCGRVWGSCKVGYARWVMWGGLCEVDHVRWITRWVTRGGSREVGYAMGHTRWVTRGGLREVGYARWITRGTSHLVKCFTPWYYYLQTNHVQNALAAFNVIFTYCSAKIQSWKKLGRLIECLRVKTTQRSGGNICPLWVRCKWGIKKVKTLHPYKALVLVYWVYKLQKAATAVSRGWLILCVIQWYRQRMWQNASVL